MLAMLVSRLLTRVHEVILNSLYGMTIVLQYLKDTVRAVLL